MLLPLVRPNFARQHDCRADRLFGASWLLFPDGRFDPAVVSAVARRFDPAAVSGVAVALAVSTPVSERKSLAAQASVLKTFYAGRCPRFLRFTALTRSRFNALM
jgi:hypothetical protein